MKFLNLFDYINARLQLKIYNVLLNTLEIVVKLAFLLLSFMLGRPKEGPHGKLPLLVDIFDD